MSAGRHDATAGRQSVQSALFDSAMSSVSGSAGTAGVLLPGASPEVSPSPQGASTDAAAAVYPSSTLVLARSLVGAPRAAGAPPLANREPPGALAMLARTEEAAAAALAAKAAAPAGALTAHPERSAAVAQPATPAQPPATRTYSAASTAGASALSISLPQPAAAAHMRPLQPQQPQPMQAPPAAAQITTPAAVQASPAPAAPAAGINTGQPPPSAPPVTHTAPPPVAAVAQPAVRPAVAPMALSHATPAHRPNTLPPLSAAPQPPPMAYPQAQQVQPMQTQAQAQARRPPQQAATAPQQPLQPQLPYPAFPGRPTFQPMMVMMMPPPPLPGAPFAPFPMLQPGMMPMFPPAPMQPQQQQHQQQQQQQQQQPAQRPMQLKNAPAPQQQLVQRHPHAPASPTAGHAAPASSQHMPRTPAAADRTVQFREPTKPFPSPPPRSPSSRGRDQRHVEVDASNLATLDSRPTLTEVELALARRVERDRTMFFLWVLAALLMLALSFHAHRAPFDRAFYSPFAQAALALAIVAAVSLLVPIVLIFLGRNLAESTPALVLLHAFLAWTASFVLYVPVLVRHVPSDDDLLAAPQLLATAFDASSRASIVAALALHATSLACFYPLLLAVVAGPKRGAEGGPTSLEKRELHAALVSVAAFDEERAANQATLKRLQRQLAEAEDRAAADGAAHRRALAAAESRAAAAREEQAQLSAIMDGLDTSKGASDRSRLLHAETLAHVHANHAAEIARLRDQMGAREKYSAAIALELQAAKDSLATESKRAASLAAELDIIRLQMSSAGLEASRLHALQERLDALEEEHALARSELAQARAQILVAKQGKCLHCDEMRNKYEQLRKQHLATAKVEEENGALRDTINALKAQLLESHRSQLKQEQRTKNKVAKIAAEVDDFHHFTQHMEPEHDY